jgi:bifunctional DNA-binding transcriptional regulator/antitoxin component of YhaV-PrlF toxin-antitoxin module
MAVETEITTMGKKGQIVIPQRILKHLEIKPRTKFAMYAKNDMIIMKAFEVPSLEKEWSKIFGITGKKNLRISEKGIYNEVQSHRAQRR